MTDLPHLTDFIAAGGDPREAISSRWHLIFDEIVEVATCPMPQERIASLRDTAIAVLDRDYEFALFEWWQADLHEFDRAMPALMALLTSEELAKVERDTATRKSEFPLFLFEPAEHHPTHMCCNCGHVFVAGETAMHIGGRALDGRALTVASDEEQDGYHSEPPGDWCIFYCLDCVGTFVDMWRESISSRQEVQ